MNIYEQKFINLFYPTSFPIAIEILKNFSSLSFLFPLSVIPMKMGIHSSSIILSPLEGGGRVRVKHFLSLRITEGNAAISTG